MGMNKIFTKLVKFAQGKKTYVVGILSVILGFLNADQQLVMTGLGLITLREAIK